MIQNVLEKSERHRKRVAYLATFVIGVFVFSVWLMIASFNIKQAVNPFSEEKTRLAQDFRSTLPSVRQSENAKTELMMNQQDAVETEDEQADAQEESKPFWKRIFGN